MNCTQTGGNELEKAKDYLTDNSLLGCFKDKPHSAQNFSKRREPLSTRSSSASDFSSMFDAMIAQHTIFSYILNSKLPVTYGIRKHLLQAPEKWIFQHLMQPWPYRYLKHLHATTPLRTQNSPADVRLGATTTEKSSGNNSLEVLHFHRL